MSNQTDMCEYCDDSSHLEERLVTVYRHRRGQHFIFEQVPARVCRECGHRYFAMDVIEEMDRLMDAPETQERVQPVPVISLAAQTPRP